MIYNMQEAKRLALAEYPQFAETLIPAVDNGWMFVPASAGHDFMKGFRLWPDYWADAVVIRSETEVHGHRIDPAGMRVWSRDGSLVEVMCGLLDLPAPGQPNSPRLAIGHAPRLWRREL